jgi:hypothetical protein
MAQHPRLLQNRRARQPDSGDAAMAGHSINLEEFPMGGGAPQQIKMGR